MLLYLNLFKPNTRAGFAIVTVGGMYPVPIEYDFYEYIPMNRSGAIQDKQALTRITLEYVQLRETTFLEATQQFNYGNKLCDTVDKFQSKL